jgi:glycosyltransferase involved in cell wall biosynthesis
MADPGATEFPEHHPVDITIVIPVYDEGENVEELYARLAEMLTDDMEVVFVDDGSQDDTADRLAAIETRDDRVRLIRLRRNFGQTAALSAGIDHARGRIIVPMDGDLQNDPRDIPKLLEKLEEGYDVVSGWRVDRKDHIRRRIPSMAANWLVSVSTGVKLHDYGCSLKAYRRSVLENVRLYGEMHRFVPIYASWQGARVTELPVRHHPRTHGESKYGMERIFKVILDLILLKFLASWSTRPIYVFGGFGLVSLFLGVVVGVTTLYLKLAGIRDFVETPLPLLVVMLLLVGGLSILLGLLAEILIRTYYESQGKVTYAVRQGREGA